MSFSAVGDVFRLSQFDDYLRTHAKPDWAQSVTLHHTAAPSLTQRPSGLSRQHIRNIRDFYQGKGWKAGPHFFIDDTEGCVMAMTPLAEKGIHAASFNASSIGIEVLGDYDSESPKTGRGLFCWQNAADATRALLDWLGLPVNEKTVLFHRDDPKTSKSCPGKLVAKEWELGLIKSV
jgi:hypothetical protein